VPPDAAEAQALSRGVASAAAPASGLTDLQRMVIEALVPAMTGHPVDLHSFVPTGPIDFAQVLARRALPFRTRIVQIMLLCALILRPLPETVTERIAAFSRELMVDEGMIEVARRFASGALGLAAADFERNGYTATWTPEDTATLHTSVALFDPWDVAVHDPELAARWADLEALRAGTLGRGVWEMYQARGFLFPGLPGSAPPLLAQHDWVHVLADYGTTVDSELEVFAFIARANDDMRAFSLLAMVLSLFETGYLRAGAGLFRSDPGHLSSDRRMPIRLADGMRRGAVCTDRMTGDDSIDFLRLDWFALAPEPVEDVRQRFNVTPKSDGALGAGSMGPFDPRGISAFQQKAGEALAAEDGRPYLSHGATVDEAS
jgi:hypothetical protein